MNKKEIKDYVFDNFDNLETLDLVKDLLSIVISDIESINTLEEEIYNLGNNNKIDSQDFESIVSIYDTIDYIIEYNER